VLTAFLLIGAATAGDIDIGVTRRLGLGVAAGLPFSVSVKWLADRRNGLAIHVGATTTTSGLHTRVQYEQWSRRLRAWEFGELGIGWQAGLVVNLVFGQASESRSARLGLTAGPLVELRLAPVPIAAFAEVAPVFYPLDLLPGSTFAPAGVTVAVGARVYLGRSKRAAASVEVPEPPAATPAWAVPEPSPDTNPAANVLPPGQASEDPPAPEASESAPPVEASANDLPAAPAPIDGP
jgi:hypothetical protein